MTGVRSMIFHPDGKALFCGLDETLKVERSPSFVFICHLLAVHKFPFFGHRRFSHGNP